jgi:Na+/H+ antiporter NhaD/arsenite permease-like protein
MIISITVSSNLQGAATLVGDTTSIMLGAYAKMDFNDFFWMNGRPGIFFAVELGALMNVPVMLFLFRKDKQSVQADQKTKVTDYAPTFLLIAMVAALIIASFNKDKPEITNGLICCIAALIAVLLGLLKSSGTTHAIGALKSIDFETLLLLTGLFVVIEGITEVGLIDDIATVLGSVGGNNVFLLYTIIVWGSVLASAFIDNIPYVATMLPVIRGICSAYNLPPMLLFFGLLIGATLGGNLTPIGASANITAAGLLKKNGYPSSFKDFAKIGIPFTLVAVTSGYLFTWIVWS